LSMQASAAVTMPAAPVAIVSVQASSESDAKYPSSSESEYIYVADNFQAKEGAKLTDTLFIGKPLGVVLQVCPLSVA